MSELRQQGYKWTVIAGRKKPTIKSIRWRLIEKKFTNKELRPQILFHFLMHDKEKYNLAMSKSASILSKLITDQHQTIIRGKSIEGAWKALQKRIQLINPMSTSRLTHEATLKKLLNFKDIYGYTSSYQAIFDKIVGFLTKSLTILDKAAKYTSKPLYWYILALNTWSLYLQSRKTRKMRLPTLQKQCSR